DGGPFVTLPQVYTEHPDRPGWAKSNLGMYRVQLAGNEYEPDRQCGLHYQIHRGIGVHHAAARRRGEVLPVCVAVGGPAAVAGAAVMPLRGGLPGLGFAGVGGGGRVRMILARGGHEPPDAPKSGASRPPLAVLADADFVITGHIDPTRTKPEGPF